MKIKRIKFNNFRQFFGEQELFFSIDDTRNVTVIHGENGAGKTAILNGFKWLLYEETDFETGNDNLVSEMARARASSGEIIQMFIEAEFEHDDRTYTVKREQNVKLDTNLDYSISGGSSLLTLTYKDSSGEFHESKNADTHIRQILPYRMHSFFFFNGERIEKLARTDAYDQIQDAIKGMMGLEIIERATRHLGTYVIKDLRKAVKDSSSADLGKLIDEQSDIESELETIREESKQNANNLKQTKAAFSDINLRLKEIEEIASLHNKRLNAEEKRNKAKESLRSNSKERLNYISQYGFLSFSEELISKANDFLEDKRSKGELPSQIRAQFIDDLLDKGNCICGREINNHDNSYNCILEYKKKTTTKDIEDAFITTSGTISSMKIERNDFIERIKEYANKEIELRKQIESLDGELDIIRENIGDSVTEDVQNLEEKREDLLERIEEYNQKIGEFKRKESEIEDNLKEIGNNIKKATAEGEQKNVANKRLELAEDAKRVIDSLHASLSEQVREELSSTVNKTFKEIIKKDYDAEISKDYNLQIYKHTGGHRHLVHDKSTGESQISSLSFISSLVSLAKKRYQSNQEYYKGGIFPIVMDSPYGSLDPEYREKVAVAIPSLADQVIILVSNSQWEGNVEEAVADKTKVHYTLIYHTPKKKEGVKTKSVIEDTDIEYTEIREGVYE